MKNNRTVFLVDDLPKDQEILLTARMALGNLIVESLKVEGDLRVGFRRAALLRDGVPPAPCWLVLVHRGGHEVARLMIPDCDVLPSRVTLAGSEHETLVATPSVEPSLHTKNGE